MNFYLIQLRNRCVLYTEGEHDQSEGKNDSQDGIDRIIQALADRQVWWGNLLSRLIRAVRDVYYRLENRIDPMERVFKRMRHDTQLTVYVSSSLSESEALAKLRSLLGSQRNRHAAWMVFDALLALGALTLTPFLVPIPGPNLFSLLSGPKGLQSLFSLSRSGQWPPATFPRLGGAGRNCSFRAFD